MNQYREEYEARKSKVLEYLDQTIDCLSRQEGQDSTVSSLNKLRSDVEKGFFSIVLVGEFSAGKSTFLNALMHKRILPSFTSETTATVNFLRHASQAPHGEAGIVYYSDGRQETLPALTLQEVERVVSTRGDTEDSKISTSVDHVDLFLESKLLQDGVMLVDSPGLNGVADHHRDITERQIKESHASIFMFSADHPGSKTDFEYLSSLKKQSHNIFFVLNKINVIRADEGQTVESVVQDLRNTYHKQFPDETSLPKIWPVAANAALVARDESVTEYQNGETVTTKERRDTLEELSRMGDFEARLWQYLTQGERTREQLVSPVNHCLANLKEYRDYLQKQITLLKEGESAADLEKQKIALEDELQRLQQNRQGISPALRERVETTVKENRERVDAGCVRVYNEVKLALESRETPEALSGYSTKLQVLLKNRYQRIATEMEDSLREDLLHVVQEEYDSYWGALEERLDQTAVPMEVSLSAETLDLSQWTISSNLEEFEKWCDETQKKISELEDEADRLEADSLEAQIIRDELSASEKELKSMRERRINLRESFQIPDVTRYTKEEEAKAWRGVFGWVGFALFGEKNPVTRTVTVEDDEGRRIAIEQRDRMLDELEQEEKRLKEKMDRMPQRGVSNEAMKLVARKARERQEKLEKKYDEKQKEFTSTLQKNTDKACRNMREYILSYVKDSQNNFTSAMGKSLNKMKTNSVAVVRDLLNLNLNQQLQRTQKKLDELIRTIETSGKEREEMLAQAEAQAAAVVELMERGISLSTSLESEMDDHIEEEALQ